MAEELLRSIELLSKERGISPDIFYSAIKEALLTVAENYFNQQTDVHVDIDREKGSIQVYSEKLVVDEIEDGESEILWKDALKYDTKVKLGDTIKIFLPSKTLGRVAAQTAKHIITQKVSIAEQQRIYEKYFPLTGTLLSGRINRIERGNIIVGLEIGEAILPPKELSPKDEYQRGDIIKFLIKRVFQEGKGPLVLGTRYMNDFVFELIKKEVPEVADGLVRIVSIARDPGVKSKVAVYSTEKTVDPVGAIVGMNGNRVLAITKELKGERVDVIAWSDFPQRFIASALTPANIVNVKIVDEENKRAEVTVTDDTLSSAIGRKGINIKLASKLTEWNIQITNRMENKFDKIDKKL